MSREKTNRAVFFAEYLFPICGFITGGLIAGTLGFENSSVVFGVCCGFVYGKISL